MSDDAFKNGYTPNEEVAKEKKKTSWLVIVFLLVGIALLYLCYLRPKLNPKPMPIEETVTPQNNEEESNELEENENEDEDENEDTDEDGEEDDEVTEINENEVYDSSGNLIGKILNSDNKKPSYQLVSTGETIYEDKYTKLENINNNYLYGSYENCKMVFDEDLDKELEECSQEYIDILSTTEEKIVKTFKSNEEGESDVDLVGNFVTSGSNSKKGFIFISEGTMDLSCKEIYTKDMKFVTDCKNTKGNLLYSNNISVDTKGNLYLAKDGIVTKYDNNGNIVKTSEKYKDLKMIIDDYIVIVKNNNLILVTPEGKEVVITSWNNDKMSLHTLLSGWFKQAGKNGIYLVVGDERVTAKEIWNDCKKTNCDYDSEKAIKKDLGSHGDGGYEYYYVPETGEVGKFAVIVGAYAKPVLYLYPTKKTNVTITFDKPGNLTTTYPKYKNNWKVTAYPNGDLYDINNKYYYALYWEEVKNHDVSFNEGFYVDKDNAIDFLEEKLTILGFNNRERNEFIMYWLPILENNKQSLVYFEQTEERDRYSKINITPAPDSILRIAMHVKKVSKKTNIKEQKLNTFNRTGFSVVEWGGVIH